MRPLRLRSVLVSSTAYHTAKEAPVGRPEAQSSLFCLDERDLGVWGGWDVDRKASTGGSVILVLT